VKKKNQDNPIEMKGKEKKYEDQFSINQMFKGEIEIIQFKNKTKKSQPTLTFKTNDSSHKLRTNLISTKKLS